MNIDSKRKFLDDPEHPFRNILFNSTLLFISAYITTTIIHEFGHFLMNYMFGSDPVIYHNYVDVRHPLTNNPKIIISALAGPLFSIIQAICFGAVIAKHQSNKPISLFYLWLCLLGFVNFFGYMLMTPFSTVGDTGKVAALLNIGMTVQYLISVAGLAILILVIIKMGRYFALFIPEGIDFKRRRKYTYHIMFFPIIVGSIIKTILAFPAPALLSIVYPATSAFVIMVSFGTILKSHIFSENISELEYRIDKFVIIFTILLILLYRLLTIGIG